MDHRTRWRFKMGVAALGALVAIPVALTVAHSSSPTSVTNSPADPSPSAKGPERVEAKGIVVDGDSTAAGNPALARDPAAARRSNASGHSGAPPADQQPVAPNDEAEHGVRSFGALASLGEINVVCAKEDSTTGPSTTALSVETVTDVAGIDPALLGAADLDLVTGFEAIWSTGRFRFPAQHGTFFTLPGDAPFPCPGPAGPGFRSSSRRPEPDKQCSAVEFRSSSRRNGNETGRPCPAPGDQCPDARSEALEIKVQPLSGDAKIGVPATAKIEINSVCPSS